MFKRILIILLIALSLQGYSQTPKQVWNKIPDDVKHVYAGTIITVVSGAVMYRLTDGKTGWSVAAGFLTGVTAGIAKEFVYDGLMHRGVVNNWDAFDTMWGSVVGFVVLRVGIDVQEKNNYRKWEEQEKLEKQKNSEEFQNLAPIK